MDAGDRAARGAAFLRVELAVALLVRVLGERHARVAALLRAVMDEAVFADIEVARAGAAPPIVFEAFGDVVLEEIHAREGVLPERHDFLENFLLTLAERRELAVGIVKDADGGGEPQLDSPMRHGERVFGILHAAAEYRINVHVKIGVFGQQYQLLVEHLQAFFGHVVGNSVVDADLKVLEARAIQLSNAVRRQQIAVGDQASNDPGFADAYDDGVELRMQQRLAAADGDDGGAHRAEPVDPAEHLVERHGFRKIVEFVAVGTGKIAAPDGNDMSQQRMARGHQTLRNHAHFAQLTVRRKKLAPNFGDSRHRRI